MFLNMMNEKSAQKMQIIIIIINGSYKGSLKLKIVQVRVALS